VIFGGALVELADVLAPTAFLAWFSAMPPDSDYPPFFKGWQIRGVPRDTRA
jgi:hypothetical protein